MTPDRAIIPTEQAISEAFQPAVVIAVAEKWAVKA